MATWARRKTQFWQQPHTLLGVVGFSYVLLAAFLRWGLHYDFFQADAAGYWEFAGARAIYSLYHVPGYSWLLGAARALLGDAHPVLVMMGINIACLLAGAWAAYDLLRLTEADARAAWLGGWLYAVWPVVGLVFAVNPWADVPATAMFLLGWRAWKRGRVGWALAGMAAALITHKGLWPFVGLWWAFTVLANARKHRWGTWVAWTLLIGLPLLGVWGAGARLHGSLLWMLERNLAVELHSRVPVFAGVVAAWQEGGWGGVLRGVALTADLALALALAWRAVHRRAWDMLAVALGVVALFAVLNAYEAMAALRFSRLLAVPLGAEMARARGWLRRGWGLAAWTLAGGAWLSQFAFAWWSVCVFFRACR